MSRFETVLGSLERYEKGRLTVIDDLPKRYCHSNVFEVASQAKPWEKIAVARNLEYVIECIRAEGESPWFAAPHDEFVVVLDGQVTVTLAEIGDPPPTFAKAGTQLLGGEPRGKRMGRVHLRRGHQALLPERVAYRFAAPAASVMIQQTIAGSLTVQRWAEICTR
jgi:hypothetical protein